MRIDWGKGKRKGKASVNETTEISLMKDWLTHVEANNIMPHDEMARIKFLSVVRGRAWTY